MKTVRRVVTGNNAAGKSVFVSDGVPPRANFSKFAPGMGVTVVWTTAPGDTSPTNGEDHTEKRKSFMPEHGGSAIVYFFVPPESAAPHPAVKSSPEAMAELCDVIMPGIAELMDPNDKGMHATPTIDYVIVLEGEIWSVLDDGQEKLLQQHDVIIQNGTRHRWRNKSDKPAKLAGIMIGAKRVP